MYGFQQGVGSMAHGAAPLGPRAYQENRARWYRERVGRALDELRSEGSEVSFYSVAERSGVSRSTLYRNPGLRAMVERARAPIAGRPALEELQRRVSALSREVAELRSRQAGGSGFAYAGIALEAPGGEARGGKGELTRTRL